jgi:YggT family protein
MDIIILPLLRVINIALSLYLWVIVIGAVLSWLVAFNVVNTRNRAVYLVGDIVNRLTEPALRPLRRFIPNLGGIDISPIALILVIYFAQGVLQQLMFKAAGVG